MSIVTSKELFVDVGGGSIYIKQWIPENPKYTAPIVLMHDSLGCVDLWRNFPEELARSLSCVVIAYDRLGFGRSSVNENIPSVNFVWDEADFYVEELTVKGVREAQTLFQRPEQMERLKKWHGNKASWVLSAWVEIWLSAKFSAWSLQSRIGKVTCPVLAIHGDRDEYGSIAFPKYIVENTAG
jgi:pimeloyl-ACP methyl ester carboxylesterase